MATFKVFHLFEKARGEGLAVTWTTDDLRLALITSAVAPVQATHDTWSDLSANEVSGTNYTAGGAELASQTWTLSSGTLVLDAADPTWAQSAGGYADARYAVLMIYDTGTPGNSKLVAYTDFGSDKGNVAAAHTIEFSSLGIIRYPIS